MKKSETTYQYKKIKNVKQSGKIQYQDCYKNSHIILEHVHYDGTPEGARFKKVSREYLKNIFCKNATTFTFENYVNNLK